MTRSRRQLRQGIDLDPSPFARAHTSPHAQETGRGGGCAQTQGRRSQPGAYGTQRPGLQLCSPCLVTTPPSPFLASLSAASPSLAPTWRFAEMALSPREQLQRGEGRPRCTPLSSRLVLGHLDAPPSAHLGQSRGRSSSSLARDTTEIQPRYNLEEGESECSGCTDCD